SSRRFVQRISIDKKLTWMVKFKFGVRWLDAALDPVVSSIQSAVAATLCRRTPHRTQDACIPMQAQTLNCPNCGAAISSDSPQCQYCESKLATVACPSCFGMMFIGSKYCPHCGAAPIQPTAAQLSVLKCPRCKIDMSSVTVGAEAM